MLQASYQTELNKFFTALGKVAGCVTGGAFCKARQKLYATAFKAVNTLSVLYFYRENNYKLWHGMRLVAVDGSTLYVPHNKKTAAHFGLQKTEDNAAFVLARTSVLYDPLNHIPISAEIAPHASSETALLEQQFSSLQAGDLLLLDRYYPSFFLFANCALHEIEFCCRMPAGKWAIIKTFLASGKMEEIVAISPSNAALIKCCDHNIDLRDLRIRLVRIELPGGEVEVLATSLLDIKRYPHHLFKELYHFRWCVEECYKIIKARMKIEKFSGKNVHAVEQEFYAHVCLLTISEIMVHPLRDKVEKQKEKHPHRINRTSLISYLRDAFATIFFDVQDALKIMLGLEKTVLNTSNPYRQGRSSPRNKKMSENKQFSMNYKPL